MKIPRWQMRQEHDEEIRAVLNETGCIDTKGHIRAWKKETGSLLKELGHTSLDFNKCDCSTLAPIDL